MSGWAWYCFGYLCWCCFVLGLVWGALGREEE